MSELTSFGKLLIKQLNENLEKELEIRNLINKYSKNNENSKVLKFCSQSYNEDEKRRKTI